jgi:hypothetical protein
VVGTDGRPAALVKVCLVEPVRCATTSESGEFRINDLRTGTYRLLITASGQSGQTLTLTSEEIEVRAGLESRVEVALPKLDAIQQSITISSPSFITPEEVKSSGYLVQPDEILKSAGALQDVSRYVQTLPGVVIGSNDFRNDIIVRGGSPLENLFIVDNIEIPNINSFANFASAGGTV